MENNICPCCGFYGLHIFVHSQYHCQLCKCRFSPEEDDPDQDLFDEEPLDGEYKIVRMIVNEMTKNALYFSN